LPRAVFPFPIALVAGLVWPGPPGSPWKAPPGRHPWQADEFGVKAA